MNYFDYMAKYYKGSFLQVVYNLVKYIRDEFPLETIFANERIKTATQIPDRCILITETGGQEKPVLSIPTFQILVRDVDNVSTRKLAYEIYYKLQSESLIGGRFGLILPAVTVKGTLYPQIQTAQISALATPLSIGKDAEGRTEFSMNFQIYI